VGESLKRALQDCARNNRTTLLGGLDHKTKIDLVVQRHEKADDDGYEIVAIERGKDKNSYTVICGARVVGETVDVTSGYGKLNRYAVQPAYNDNRKTVSASAVGQMLVKVVQLLHGTCVRSVGGVYYLPDGGAADWQELCTAVEEPDGTQITWYNIQLNPSNMRAIATAITAELTAASQESLDKVSSGELGKIALENREKEMAKCRKKMQEYEAILDAPLRDVRKALEETETAIAMAKMAVLSAS
jgi:hypothetical protein